MTKGSQRSHPARRVSGAAVWRAVLALAAGAGALLVLLSYREHAAVQRYLISLVTGPTAVAGLAELAEPLGRESDLSRARSGVARALLSSELGEIRDLSVPADAATVARLELARELAARALAERPALAPAASALGMATYLSWRRQFDRRLFTEAWRWERPLELARDLTGDRGEASRLLAIAYLELWQSLSPEKREKARLLVGDALGDERYLGRLLEPWMNIARDLEEALAALPANPGAWEAAMRILAERGDWDYWLEAADRADALVVASAEANLEAARALRDRGRPREAREQYLSVLARLSPGPEHASLARTALEEAPPAPPASRWVAAHRAWLEWVLTECARSSCPFPGALIDRLRGMAGELTPPDQALAFWFGGRPEEAVRLERRADDLRGWEPYLVAKARDLAIRGNGGEALAVLEGIATAARDTAYWEAVQAAAAADGDERRQALAGAELERTATSRVSREGFVLANESWRGELLCTRPVAGLTLSLRAETGGAGLDVRLDGERIGRFVLRGEQRITFDVAVEPGRHVVSVHARSGGSVTPVALELLGR